MNLSDLELLENVEMRFALAATDEKFQSILKNYLSAVLAKLSSPEPGARQKILQLLGHVNKRLKSSPTISLPVSDLIELFNNKNAGTLAHNFSLIYLEMGLQRLEQDKAQACVDKLIWGFASRPHSQQIVLFSVIVPVLAHFVQKRPHQDGSTPKPDPLDLENHPNDIRFILKKVLDFVLYEVPYFKDEEKIATPPGLSPPAVEFVTNQAKAKWTKNPQELREAKMGLLKFINNPNLLPSDLCHTEKFLVFLAASADPAHEVVSLAEDGIRRNTKPDLEDATLVAGLFQLYQGDADPALPEAVKRLPGTPHLKTKVLSYMCKSIAAANLFPNLLQVSFDALYGPSSIAKQKTAGMGFVQWVHRHADVEKLTQCAPILLSGLLKFIDEGTDHAVRGFAYEAVGLLAKRVPSRFKNDIDVLRSFFDALTGEDRNVRVSVQEALGTMCAAYVDSEIKDDIMSLLMTTVEKPDSSCRFISTKFANTIFPFSYAPARMIALIAYSDQKLEVKEEARRGVTFPAISDISEEEYRKLLPSLNSMVNIIHAKCRKLPSQFSTQAGVKYLGGLTTESYTRSVEFIRRLIVMTANPTEGYKALKNEEFSEGSVEVTGDVRTSAMRHLKELWDVESESKDNEEMEIEYGEFLNTDGEHGSFGAKGYLDLLEKALLSTESDAVLHAMAATCLKELITLSPSSLCKTYYSKMKWLKPFTTSVKVETRLATGHILASVASNDLDLPERKNEFQTLLNETFTMLKDTGKHRTFEKHHGSLVAIGYLIGRVMYRYRNWQNYVDKDIVGQVVDQLLKDVEHQTNSVISIGACNSLAEMGRYNLLPAKSNEDILQVVTKLEGLAKMAKEHKVQEVAITALAHIALGSVESDVSRNGKKLYESIIEFFYSLAPMFSKHVEIHFTIGEALGIIAGGWASIPMEQFLDIADVDQGFAKSSFERTELLDSVVGKIMSDLLTLNSVSQVVKKSYCVWLLSVTKFCGTHNGLKGKLKGIHQVFSSLLSDRDELTQDCASKGIGVVYELGDESLKKELVGSLVETLSEGKKIQPQSLTGDTQLFGENTLGSSPDGSSITTYQSILSLASDMNQPDMVYKFMSLASHHAMWNSRRGASLGFGSIMNTSMALQAEKELRPFMAKLVPRLYRFQFDPNAKVADAMRSIWKSLVREPKKAIDEHFDIIISEILKGLGDRLWRTRESSCNALSDIITGREISQLEPYMEQIWAMCHRALDDIKESVRVAALSTCKNLSNMTIRYCDPSYVSISQGQKVMDIVMPFFLKKGLFSMSEDVRKFSLGIVLKISKKGGVLLKPHLCDFTTILLEGLSSLEPQVMNYLSFHVEKYSISQNQLDSTRLSAANMSPIMDAVESTIQYLDGLLMEELSPKLSNLIRKGIGLPTKAGSARYLISLCLTVPLVFKPHADTMLQALSGVIGDRSIPVRKSFAAAAGYCANLASDNALARFINHSKKIYIENDQDDVRSIAEITLKECTKHANDKMKKFQSDILPLAFFGSRDANSDICEGWKVIWDNLASGATTSATKMYTKEIVQVCGNIIETSPSWPVKKQVGKSFSDLVRIVDKEFYPYMKDVVNILLEALSGRTWDGKEAVLEALCNVCTTGKDWCNSEENCDILDQIIKVGIREMRKNNKAYKRYALDCVSAMFNALEVNRFEEVKDYLIEMAIGDDQSSPQLDTMDIDEVRERPMALVIQANAFRALGRFFPTTLDAQVGISKELCCFLVKNIAVNVWNVRQGVLEALELYLTKLHVDKATLSTEMVDQLFFDGLVNALEDAKYRVIREKAVNVGKILFKKGSGLFSDSAKVDQVLKRLITDEKVPLLAEELKKLKLSS